jgi:hypothetical protein
MFSENGAAGRRVGWSDGRMVGFGSDETSGRGGSDEDPKVRPDFVRTLPVFVRTERTGVSLKFRRV